MAVSMGLEEVGEAPPDGPGDSPPYSSDSLAWYAAPIGPRGHSRRDYCLPVEHAPCARCCREPSDDDRIDLLLMERPEDVRRVCRSIHRCPNCGYVSWRWADRPEDPLVEWELPTSWVPQDG